MNFLINSSNVKGGGGIQVTDSICGLLNCYPQHLFVVVLSSFFNKIKERMKDYDNVVLLEHNIQNDFSTIVFGRDSFLDKAVEKYHIDAVLTVFGPSRWNPRCSHLCGFARSQLVLKDSPFYQTFSFVDKLKLKVLAFYFRRCSKNFWTENPLITELVKPFLGKTSKVHTVTNYYNQVFDQPQKWEEIALPPFNGTTLLTVSSYNLHKNFPIMAEICHRMRGAHPNFSFRFVLTLDRQQCSFVTEEIEKYFVFLGKVDVSQCPSLYQQSDIMFMPTLMECFSATYPEAMRMEVPIVTTDLNFARGLCGNAALYYEPTNPVAAAEAIYQVATDDALRKKLVDSGKKQLLSFDTYEQRCDKLIKILESIVETN